MELETAGVFLISDTDKVQIYDSKSMEHLGDLPVTLFKSESRETIQVLSMEKSKNENQIALISGRKLIKDQTFFNQIFIFERDPDGYEDDSHYKYELVKRCVIKDNPDFFGVCKRFHFL